MPTITNIAAYKFATLRELKPLREQLITLCKQWGLKGTILLSVEGINLFVAGSRSEIDLLLAHLRSIPGLESLQAKVSESDNQPFQRMLVKIKREIISFGVEGIDPVGNPSPKLSAQELKRWLDDRREITLLDTRNDYEVKLGTFHNALTLNIDHFRQFPDAVRALPEEMKKRPIVMFCTGGIRCEKAGPFMQRQGFEQIFQLDGGILKYFEECGGAHYDGDCFVFDQRVGLDPELQESETIQCFVCQTPLTPEDQQDARYIESRSCPYCFQTTDQHREETLIARHNHLQKLTNPLPGSQPYTNQRPLNVPEQFDGVTLLEFLCGILPQIARDEWMKSCEEGRICRRLNRDDLKATDSTSVVAASAESIVRAGDRYLHVQPFTSEPAVNAQIQILYEDEAILVVNKPAPLPMHPCGRFNRNTLQSILSALYHPQSPRPAHRLDANTSGLVLFSRTRHFAKMLQQQFNADQSDQIEKRYLARVIGHPADDSFSCRLPISDEPNEVGSRQIDLENGLPAHTDFQVIRRYADGTALLEVTPWTGRTNQIRVHLWHLGIPIVGDSMYLPNGELGSTLTSDVEADPLCLLAQRITFNHPFSRERVSFEAPLPEWWQA